MDHNPTSKTKQDEIYEILQKAPKPQLHLHLDGSLSFDFIMRANGRKLKQNPDDIVFEKNWIPASEDELFAWFSKMTTDSLSNNLKAEKNSNWRTFTICNKFLQTKENLIDAASDIVYRIATEHNVNYLEIRFAPVLHTHEGLSEKEVVLSVCEGFNKGVSKLKKIKKEMYGGLILCALRSYPLKHAIETVRLISDLKNETILGFDVAGDEGSYPLKNFEEAIVLAKELGIRLTTHAGEWNEKLNDCILDNLQLAVEIGVNRIGHGVALRSFEKGSEIFQNMEAKNISVEVNLTSNCTDPKIVTSYATHPLPSLLKKGVKVAGLNVDNWLLSGNIEIGRSEPTGEYIHAIIDCGLSMDEILSIVECGYRAGFATVPDKLIEDSLAEWKLKVIPQISAILQKN